MVSSKVIAFIAVILTAAILVGTAKFDWGILSTISGVSTVSGCQFVLQAQFGRIECEPISSTQISKWENSVSGKSINNPAIAGCGDNENTNLCDFVVRVDGVQGTVKLFYQVDGAGACPIGGTSQDKYCAVSIPTNDDIRIRTLETLGRRFAVGGACMGLCIFDSDWKTTNIYSNYIPFGLNVYDSGQKVRYNTQSCDLASLGFADKDDVCTKSDGSACLQTKTSNRLAFDDWVNYLATFTYAPIDVSNKVVTYNGQQAYCQINSIYSLSEFSTDVSAGGTCYKYPKTKIASVDCCPGMETANSRCGDDFKWKAIIIGDCDANRPCQAGYSCVSNYCQLQATCFSDVQCSGGGGYYVDYSKDKTISKQSCVSGQCKVVESKIVECTTNAQCPTGKVCSIEQGYKCIGQTGAGVYCGDGVCSSPTETVLNCNTDCKVPPPNEIPYLIYLIFIPLAALLGYVTNKKQIEWAGIGAIIGLIIALILEFVLKNWLILALGTALGGGIVLWLFGGAILMIIMALIARKK